MDFDQLKSNWDKAVSENYQEKELAVMTKINAHPVLKKIKTQLTLESILLSTMLFLYYDGFDGHTKPLYVNLMLVISMLLFIGNDLIAFRLISHPIAGKSIRESVRKRLASLKRIAAFSVGSSLIYGASLLLFFSSTIVFTEKKYLTLGGMVIFLAVMMVFSYQKWRKKIKTLEGIASEFDQ